MHHAGLVKSVISLRVLLKDWGFSILLGELVMRLLFVIVEEKFPRETLLDHFMTDTGFAILPMSIA